MRTLKQIRNTSKDEKEANQNICKKNLKISLQKNKNVEYLYLDGYNIYKESL